MHSSSSATKLTFLTVVIVSVSNPAYGYIDPGTGSLIIQGIIGAIAAVGVTLKIYWHKVRIFFSGRSDAVDADDDQLEDSGK